MQYHYSYHVPPKINDDKYRDEKNIELDHQVVFLLVHSHSHTYIHFKHTSAFLFLFVCLLPHKHFPVPLNLKLEHRREKNTMEQIDIRHKRYRFYSHHA